MPEVEHIAHEIHGSRLVLDAVQKTHQTAFLHTTMLDGATAQVGV